MSSSDISYKIKLNLVHNELFFGPGVARLLGEIETTGSINAACHDMGLSYTKGYRMIKKTEEHLGFKLLERKIGGNDGGSSSLNNDGKAFLQAYHDMLEELNVEAEKLFDKYFAPLCRERGSEH